MPTVYRMEKKNPAAQEGKRRRTDVRSVEVVDDRGGLHESQEPVLLHVLPDHAVGQVIEQGLRLQVGGQALGDVAVERMHATREVLAVVQEQLAAGAEPQGGGGIEPRVTRDVHTPVDDEPNRVHALVHTLGGIRNVLDQEGLHADPADRLLPAVDAEAVELARGHQVEEMAGDHLSLGAVQVDLLAEREAALQCPPPESLGVAVRHVEVRPELARVTGSEDTRHVQAHLLVRTLGRLLHERRLVAPLERQFLHAATVVRVRVRDEQVLHVVDRDPELRHLQRRLGPKVNEQGSLALHNDEVALKHLRGERRADAQRHHPQLVVLGGERQLPLVSPHPHTRSEELGRVRAQIEFGTLERHGFSPSSVGKGLRGGLYARLQKVH